MDITNLRVMNCLYNLGLTEQILADIEAERKCREKTGVSVKHICNKGIICIIHDEKHSIAIKKLSDFPKDIKPNMRILLKTLIAFDELPNEIFILHKIGGYRALDDKIVHTANNLEELKEKVIDRFTDKYEKVLGISDDDYYDEFKGEKEDRKAKSRSKRLKIVEEQLRAVYWLLDEKYDLKLQDLKLRKNIGKIIKVFQRKNVRLAIIQEQEAVMLSRGFSAYKTCENIKLRVQAYKPTDKRYDYVSNGREIYFGNNEMWVCDDELNDIIQFDEFRLIDNHEGYYKDEKFFLLKKREYDLIKDKLRIKLMETRRETLQEENKELLHEKIAKQFSKGKVCRQGFEITPKSFSCNGIMIKGDRVSEFIERDELPLRENLEINNILRRFFDYLLDKRSDSYSDVLRISFQGKIDFSIGKNKITFERVKESFFINGYKVKREEISDILLMAYRKQEGYNEWLFDVSKECLKIKEALKNGLTFTLVIDSTDDNCLSKDKTTEYPVALSLKKVEKNIFVSMLGKDYRLRDSNSLFNLQKKTYYSNNEGYLQRTIRLLSKGLEINPEDIGLLIREGKKEYEMIIERSKEFLKNAVRITGATITGQGTYIVKGESGMEYSVDDEGNCHKMKNGEDDEYLCIQDIGRYSEKDIAYTNDKIAKRLIALKHDRAVAQEIWNLGDKNDKWWLELQNGK